MKKELGLSILFDFFSLSSCSLYHHVESKEEICVMAGNNDILVSGTSMHLAFSCCRFKFVGSRCLNNGVVIFVLFKQVHVYKYRIKLQNYVYYIFTIQCVAQFSYTLVCNRYIFSSVR